MLPLSIRLRQSVRPAAYPQPTLRLSIGRPVDCPLGSHSQARRAICIVVGRQVVIPTVVDQALVQASHPDNQSATYPAQIHRVSVAQAVGNLIPVIRHRSVTTPTVLRNLNPDALGLRSVVPMLALTVMAIQRVSAD